MAVKFLNGIDVDGSMNITANDIPDHSARKITSDTLDAARIPDLSGTYQPVGNYLTSIPSEYLTQTEGDARYLQSLPSHNHDTLYDAIGSADAVQTWVGEQNFATDAAISTAVSNYLPLSGGTLTGNINANGSILGDGNLFLRSYNNDPKGIFFRDGFEYGDANQYNLSITIHNDGDGAADGMMISAYDGVRFNVASGSTPNTKFSILNTEVKAYANFVSTGTITATGGNSSNWNTAYGWGNHASAGYLTSIPSTYATDAEVANAVGAIDERINTEVFDAIATVQGNIPTNNNQLTNGAGYYSGTINLGSNDLVMQGSDPGDIVWKDANGTETHRIWAGSPNHLTYRNNSGTSYAIVHTGLSGYNASNWNTAYGWGNHASAGYLTSIPSSYATDAEVNAAVSVVNDRIETEILPSIPTNNNQLTNGAGYLTTSGKAADSNLLDGIDSSGFVRAYVTSNDNIDNDWGQSFKTFDPIPSGTPPLQSPNIRTINIGENFQRRTQLAFDYNTDKAFFRRRTDTWKPWQEFYHTGNLSLATLGYTGATNANYITNNNQLTNGAGYATTSYVNTAVSNLVASAPAALDTLNELAAALGDDANFSTTIANNIGAVNTRIDTEVFPAIDEKQNAGNYATFSYITLNDSTTTASFIAELTNEHGAFQDNYRAYKVGWSYAGNSDLDVGFESVELAGCLIECFGGTYKHVRLTRPTTGTGGRSIYVYNDQGSSYAPGWRQIWTSDEFSSTNVSNWNTAYGWGNHASAGYLTSIPSTYATDAEVNSAVAVVDSRIDTEVLPAIPTNNNQLTNGAGYITSADGGNAQTLDGINSTSFLRSDANDTMSGVLTITGNNGVSKLRLEGTTPTIDLDDSDGDSFYIHVNSNQFYVLADRNGGGNYGEWETPHPLQLDAATNKTYLWGNLIGNAAYASTSDFDAAGSAAAVDSRIDTEVLPAIPSNNNQLTNGAGYLTSVPSSFTTGNVTVTGYIKGNGQQLVLSAGEAQNYATGQTAEYIYMNAEQGIEVNSETGNWSGGWAARKTAYLRGDQLTLDGESLTKTNIQNFKTAYGWGNHGAVGYATQTWVGEQNYASDAAISTAIATVTLSSLGYTGATNANYITNNNQLTNGAGYTTNTGTITGVSTGTGLDGTASSGSVTITLDLSELTDMTAAIVPTADEIILLDNGAERRKLFSEIFGSAAYVNTGSFDAAGSAAAVQTWVGEQNFATDAAINTAIGTVTLASLGYTGATNANYITNNNQLTNGAGYITSSGSITGNAATASSAGYVTNQGGQLLRHDNRTISPAEISAGYLQFGFTSFQNNNSGGYADFLHLRSYTDSSGGRDNLVMFSKDSIEMRIWQQDYNSASPYEQFRDVAFKDEIPTNNNQLTNGAGYLTTSGKAADSNLLDGLDLHTGRNNQANKVVRTNGSGYVDFGWINTTSGNTTSALTDIYVNTNDGYIRKATPAHFRSQITDGAYDSIGSADAVNARIDSEVLPSIPTNNNQLTNGAGYITSSHTHTPAQAGLSNLSSNGNALAGSFTATGDITAFSDARVKENVETLPNALESVKQMRGVTYNKIGEEKQSVGVIAQELEEVVPQLVHTDEEGMKSVAYGNITAVLIEALKEQQAQIEELKSRLDGLTK
jgi:uncharacterized protein YidB (DUF937 family)